MKLFALLLTLFTLNAQAEESAALVNESSSRFDWSSMLEKTDLSYSLLFTGATLQHPDANLDGKGSNYTWRNYVSAGYEFAKNWQAETGVEFRQYFRPEDPKKPGRSNFEWRDPYVGIDRKNVVKTDRFSLALKGRYYIPATEYNKSNVGKEWDQGNGALSLKATPAWNLGDFYLSCATEVQYKFAEAKNLKVHQNYSFKIKPMASYRFHKQWSAKLEYSTGDINHRTNGRWTKLNDPAIGQNVYTGVTWTATKKLSVSPSIGWSTGSLQLRKTELGLFASYYLL